MECELGGWSMTQICAYFLKNRSQNKNDLILIIIVYVGNMLHSKKPITMASNWPKITSILNNFVKI